LTYFLVKDGKYIPVAKRLSEEKNEFVRDITEEDQDCGYLDTFYPHPYLGFVHHGNRPCDLLALQTNNIGLFGYDYPFLRQKDYFVVLVTGGSVAARFAQIFPNGPRYLEEILNNRYKQPDGKKFIVLNGGEGAWSYPQQIILFILYADVVDAVITIDGWNEFHAMRSGYRLGYDGDTLYHRVNPLVDNSYEGLLRAWLNNKIYLYARNNWLLSRSYLAYIATSFIKNAISGYHSIDESKEKRKTSIESIFSLPKEWDAEQMFTYNTEQYNKYIKMISYIAQKMDIKSAHFIQPIPAIGKVLTEQEKRVVGNLSYGEEYASMTSELLRLNDEGIPIYSLLDIFEDVEENIYADPIHFTSSNFGHSLGNLITARRIADILEAEWKLERR
jgi:hypothetical protein